MITEMIDMMRESLNTSADLLKNFGNAQDTEKAMEQFNNGLTLIKTLIPTLFCYLFLFHRIHYPACIVSDY